VLKERLLSAEAFRQPHDVAREYGAGYLVIHATRSCFADALYDLGLSAAAGMDTQGHLEIARHGGQFAQALVQILESQVRRDQLRRTAARL
jgi:hypothetical protein